MSMTDWTTLLAASGAQLRDDTVMSFGDERAEAAAALERTVVAPLADRAVIAVSGSDARDFLSAQLTIDVDGLAPGTAALAAWCSPQGRAIVLLQLVAAAGDALRLLVPRSLAGAIARRLGLYILRARVTVTVSDEVILGVRGPGATACCHAAEVAARASAGSELLSATARVPASDTLLIAAAEQAASVWRALTACALPIGSPAWRLGEIMAGIPSILPETSDRFLPQMLNLDLLGGLAFDKGCYPGQEVIARLRYRGTLKRRTWLAAAAADVAPPGTSIVGLEADGEEAGVVLSSALHPDGRLRLLAVLSVDAATAPGLALATAAGARLELLELPSAPAT